MSKLDQYLLNLANRINLPSAAAMAVTSFFLFVGGTAVGLEWLGLWPIWLNANW